MSKHFRFPIQIICLALLIFLPIMTLADWPQPPACLLPMLYNYDFDNGLMGWDVNTLFPPFGIPNATDHPFNGVVMLQGESVGQPITLPPGEYTLELGLLLDAMGPIQMGRCPVGTEWGEIVVRLNNQFLFSHDIEAGVSPPYDTYYQIDYSFYLAEERGGAFTVYWLGGDCITSAAWLPDPLTIIKLDWVSLCKTPDATWTPTVTGTPPETGTPTATATVFCEATEWPTGTPYATQTTYPTATDWLTPPVLLTPTPADTYTPWPTCVPGATMTPYASATPFRFAVPLTYTDRFADLEDGFTNFFTSTEGLIDDVEGIMISASTAVSDVTAFGITTTVNISGTPVATTDMVTTFVSNMDALRYVFGWFSIFGSIAPGPFWFLLICVAWTIFVMAFKWISTFFSTTLWPLARTIWDIIIDIWDAIPFI